VKGAALDEVTAKRLMEAVGGLHQCGMSGGGNHLSLFAGRAGSGAVGGGSLQRRFC